MNIDGKTILTGLLGSPVSHSISPLMHNLSFDLLNLNYSYLCFDVNTDQLKTAVDGLKALGVRGFNCTMPVKNLMCELADILSPAAKLSGAVNTVVNDDGVLTGHNTDGLGYIRSLSDIGFHIANKNMTLLGAGGAATAIATQAALDGVSNLHIFSRRSKFWNRAQSLVDTINSTTSCNAELFELSDLNQLKYCLDSSDILTNATSVGMAPNTDASLITDMTFFHQGLIVSDVIYNPRKTLLLQQAESQGCLTHNGLYMLLYQGAEAFKIWTKKDMPIAEVKEKYFS